MKTKLKIEMEIELDIYEDCNMKLSEMKREIKRDVKSGCCGVYGGDYAWDGFKNIKVTKLDKMKGK